MNRDIFTVSDLSFSYGDRRILSHLNFTVPRGKIVTFMGGNGCGKSTLFQLLTKNLTPDQGKICLDGQDIRTMGLRSFARKAAIVHQYNTAPADLTVEKLVAYGRTPHQQFGRSADPGEDERMTERAMRITGVEKFRERPVAALSGGQKQRVWIAMALAQGTDTLLLDEPTTYLDVRYQIQLLRLIQGLNRKYGTTVLMVLHDINQAMAYSDEIIALSPGGELAAQGVPHRVITSESLKRIYRIDLETVEVDGKKFVRTF